MPSPIPALPALAFRPARRPAALTRFLALALGLALLCGLGRAAPTAEEIDYDPDVQILLRTHYFAFGPLGLGTSNRITEGEAALRRILRKPEALRYLFPVFDRGTLEGKCYALIVFRELAPAYFESRQPRLNHLKDSPVKTVSGCVLGEQKLGAVVQRIAEEAYRGELFGPRKS